MKSLTGYVAKPGPVAIIVVQSNMMQCLVCERVIILGFAPFVYLSSIGGFALFSRLTQSKLAISIITSIQKLLLGDQPVLVWRETAMACEDDRNSRYRFVRPASRVTAR